MSSSTLKVIPVSPVEIVERDGEVQPGQWWWYHRKGVPGSDIQTDEDEDDEDEDDDEAYEDEEEDDDEDRYRQDYDEEVKTSTQPILVCVLNIGSNYVGVRAVRGDEWRHPEHSWYDHFLPASDAEGHIAEKKEFYQGEVERLLAEVHEITRRLGVGREHQLTEQTTQALVVRSEGSGYDEYKAALVKAQKKTIPAIYSQMREANKALTDWLTAPTLPMSVIVTDQSEVIDQIKRRVFNVELYAGLTEEIEQVCDGEPAEMGDKLHLMQRRAYMDEECLVNYETGGMSFGNIRQFDEWLALPKNRDRLLPFPRCMLAFKVRRHSKRFSGYSIQDFIDFRNETFYDDSTFLYVRNGERLYCVQTKIDFGEKLFPDLDHSIFSSGQLVYAREYYRRFEFMTEGEWLQKKEDLSKEKAAYEAEYAAWKATPKSERGSWMQPRFWYDGDSLDEYEPFTPENLYYDDILEYIKVEAEGYNRISLLIQGLFDRSDMLHPHPKVRTWTPEGFGAAIALHYDASRAVTDGDPPDFEAFRARLNETLGEGCKTVGQTRAWGQFVKSKKEEARDEYSTRRHYYGPGPDAIATVSDWKPRARKAVFRWGEYTQSWNAASITKRRRFEVPASKLLNLDAYQPGDFRQFFADPRTRENYAQWAPFLLLAEEYCAGNVDAQGHPMTKANAKECSSCGDTFYGRHACSWYPDSDDDDDNDDDNDDDDDDDDDDDENEDQGDAGDEADDD